MRRVVWKFPLQLPSPGQTQEVWMPEGAEIVHVHPQGDQPVLWAIVDPGRPSGPRRFQVLATGYSEVPDGAKYLGTVHLDWTVWHVVEVP